MGLAATRRQVVYRLPALTLCALVVVLFLYDRGINDYHRARFGDMVYGTAHKPFVYRTLLPTTVRVIAAAIPSPMRSFLERALGESYSVQNLFTILRWEQKYLVEYLTAAALIYLSLWGFSCVFRDSLNALFVVSRWTEEIVVVAALLGVPPFFRPCNYLYDFPT